MTGAEYWQARFESLPGDGERVIRRLAEEIFTAVPLDVRDFGHRYYLEGVIPLFSIEGTPPPHLTLEEDAALRATIRTHLTTVFGSAATDGRAFHEPSLDAAAVGELLAAVEERIVGRGFPVKRTVSESRL
jgi:hypothetical protein